MPGVYILGKYYIKGGKPLLGEVKIQGSKNAVLPMMAAALLHEGTTILHNCPQILDVYQMEKILQSLGAVTEWNGHTLTICCEKITGTYISQEDACSMRSSVILMGSLLSRNQKVSIGFPGGCTIGRRPIDLHLMVLQQMGAEIQIIENEQKGEWIKASVKGRLTGQSVCFPISSVGATEQAILAAVLAKGTTILRNCAREPEIIHLCEFLQAMGAEIGGIGTENIWIRGVSILRDVEYMVPTDRIVAGTYLYGCAATRGKITLINPPVEEMAAVLRVYEKMGGQWAYKNGKLLADASKICKPIEIETDCYPGFPTDMQSVLLATLLTIPGESRVKEKIFENRFQTVSEFIRMNAEVKIRGEEALVRGKTGLKGSNVVAKELRGGAALIVAGLAAEGITIISNSHFVERGYVNIVTNIQNLGGQIKIKG